MISVFPWNQSKTSSITLVQYTENLVKSGTQLITTTNGMAASQAYQTHEAMLCTLYAIIHIWYYLPNKAHKRSR